MRPWMVVSASVVGAVAVVAVIAWPELAALPRAAILPAELPRLPVFSVAFLGVYALCAILLTVAGLISGALRLRRRLGTGAVYRAANPLDWIAAFEAAGLRALAPVPALVQPRSSWADAPMLWQSRPDRRALRAEAAQLYYIGLARSHFCTALIAIAVVIALGLAQAYGPTLGLAGPVPTIPAALILIGLLLLAALGRLAVDVAFEPLIETISRLPIDAAETGLLRRAVEVLDAAASPASGSAREAPPPAVPERLATVLEEGQRNLAEAIVHMSAAADALGDTTRSSLEAFEAALRRAPKSAPEADGARLTELQSAVEALTAALERLSVSAEAAASPTAAGHKPAEPQLARELQRLLQEIETNS